MSSNQQTNKFTKFIRNNAALLLIIFCAVAIGVVVLITTLGGGETTPVGPGNAVEQPTDNGKNETPVTPPVDDTPKTVKVYFAAPLTYSSVSMEYSDGTDVLFVYNKTLGSWATHNAVDLAAEDGAEVAAMYDGTVLSVTEEYGMGNIVKVDHGNNVIATYASLAEVDVVKGQTLKKGDKIGTVGTTAAYEFTDGAHLHLEVAVDGKKADPMPYVEGKVFREVQQ